MINATYSDIARIEKTKIGTIEGARVILKRTGASDTAKTVKNYCPCLWPRGNTTNCRA